MASAWVTTGKLLDGTELMGPFICKPDDTDHLVEVEVDGLLFWVRHRADEPLSPENIAELRNWVSERMPAPEM